MAHKVLAAVNSHFFQDYPNHQILTFIRNTSRLSVQLQQDQRRDTLVRLLPSISEGLSDLKNWEIPIYNPPDATRWNANEIWRQGALANFYNIICKLDSTDDRLQTCVRITVNAMQQIPSKTGMLRSVGWPLFMIGVQAINPTHRTYLKGKLIEVGVVTGLHSYLSAAMVLSEVWKEFDAKQSNVSEWQAIMSSSGWELMMLF